MLSDNGSALSGRRRLHSTKKEPVAAAAFEALVPSLPKSRKLVKRTSFSEPGKWNSSFEIEGTMSHYFARRTVTVSPEVFAVLMAAGGNRTLATLFGETGTPNGDRRPQVREEMENLWTKRIITLKPRR